MTTHRITIAIEREPDAEDASFEPEYGRGVTPRPRVAIR